MGESIPVGRACGLCGEQVVLDVEKEWSEHTDDLTGLMNTSPGEGVIIKAECGCPTPRRVKLQGTTLS